MATMPADALSTRLCHEYQARRARNPRYSLRAFAAYLGADHSTVSQVMRGRRRPHTAHIRRWTAKLGCVREETLAYLAAARALGTAAFERETLVRHWIAEAMAIVDNPLHWKIVRLCGAADFQADARWLATRAGVTTEDVNLAICRLLRLGLLELVALDSWKSDAPKTEPEFRALALTRVRERSGI
jgi:hypothetical protein